VTHFLVGKTIEMETQMIDDYPESDEEEIEDRGNVIAYVESNEVKYPLYKGRNFVGRYRGVPIFVDFCESIVMKTML
jgi:hypothetical protein